jgi:hypothetical protein
MKRRIDKKPFVIIAAMILIVIGCIVSGIGYTHDFGDIKVSENWFLVGTSAMVIGIMSIALCILIYIIDAIKAALSRKR